MIFLNYYKKNYQSIHKIKLKAPPEVVVKNENLSKEIIDSENQDTYPHLLDALCIIFNITPATFFYTPREFSGDDSLFTKIDSVIDEELAKLGIHLKEMIRR